MNIQNSKFYRFLAYFCHIRSNYYKPLKFDSIDACLDQIALEKRDIFFIQVGSNDGINNDPLYRFIGESNWRGICIEPITDNFNQLKLTHQSNSQIQLVNAAIGEDGEVTIYRIDPQKAEEFNVPIPSWYSQLASFNKDLVVSDIESDDKYKIIVREQVKSLSFKTLAESYNVQKVDLLHIDVEGADWMVLKSFCFDRLKPSFIIYEHAHLSKKDYLSSLQFLKTKGYKLLQVNMDTFAYEAKYSSYFKNIKLRSKRF